ncbi:uncharacterized protein LOC110221864 isoform X1 [Phascolarctos cinereus]|uniref:Uncharacterized protein LOC110221864 isoform X1 n=1 Tax=Phascolarctos cinereus TaxID=38626 RepID=A0A6P5LUH1_PHACI|nr:uncharacterized protein LOC110221864 isoform X1 [Phascolarctos cinereus]
MGRLDDNAKKRIVELRKAGLSFRKIKKVLELDNIRVTPQAIYLFLKRKNVDPRPLPGNNHSLPPRDPNSRQLALSRAGWEDEQLWDLLQENEVKPKESLESQPAGPRGEPGAGQGWDGKEGIRIVSVTSLCQGSGAHPKDTCSSEVSQAPANSKLPGPYRPVLVVVSNKKPKESLESQPAGPRGESGAGQSWDGKEGIRIVSVTSLCQGSGAHPKDTCSDEVPQAPANSDIGIGLGTPGPVSKPASPYPLSRGRNSALIVKKKIVDRAIFLHKKATVQSAQRGTSSSLPLLVEVQSPRTNAGLPDLKDSNPHVQDMGTQTRVPWVSAQGLAEKLDAMQRAVQQVLEVLQVLMRQQSRLEQQQEQQQRWQQQVLGTLQQLTGPAQSQGPGTRESQDLGSPGTPEGPNFHQFKMELL